MGEPAATFHDKEWISALQRLSLVLQLQDTVDTVGNVGASQGTMPTSLDGVQVASRGSHRPGSSPTPWDPQAWSPPSGLPPLAQGPSSSQVPQRVPPPDRHHPVHLDRQKEGLLLRQDGSAGSVEVDPICHLPSGGARRESLPTGPCEGMPPASRYCVMRM